MSQQDKDFSIGSAEIYVLEREVICNMNDCIFCKIINREIPAEIVYEDELVLAFKDIHPVTPIHILVIPKKHVESVLGLEEDDKNLVRTDFYGYK